MATLQALRDEHRGLWPHIEQLRTTADAVGAVRDPELAHLVDESLSFLTHHLVPHAQAEDAALYPVVDRVLGATGATATMRRDHVEVVALVEELQALRRRLAAGEPGSWLANDLRRVLFGLYAVVRLHFAKEEEIYVPLLEEHLNDDEMADMLEQMQHAAATAVH